MELILIKAIELLCNIITALIFVRILLSYLPIEKSGQFSTILFNLTEPILGPIRALVEKSSMGSGMMLDFSPIIAWFLISVVKELLIMVVVRVF